MQCGLKDERLSVLHCQARYSATQAAMALPMGREPARSSGQRSYFERLHEVAMVQIRRAERKGSVVLTRPPGEGGGGAAADSAAARKLEGNEELYSAENLMRRNALATDPTIRGVTREFWDIVDLLKNESGNIGRLSYVSLNTLLHRALVGDVSHDEASRSAEVDWARDTARGPRVADVTEMDYDLFHRSMFELADIWCENIAAHEYGAFLRFLLSAVSFREELRGGADGQGAEGPRRLLPFDQVLHMVSALRDWRAAGDASDAGDAGAMELQVDASSAALAVNPSAEWRLALQGRQWGWEQCQASWLRLR